MRKKEQKKKDSFEIEEISEVEIRFTTQTGDFDAHERRRVSYCSKVDAAAPDKAAAFLTRISHFRFAFMHERFYYANPAYRRNVV